MMYTVSNITNSSDLHVGSSKTFICDDFCEWLESRAYGKTVALKLHHDTAIGLICICVCAYVCDCVCACYFEVDVSDIE